MQVCLDVALAEWRTGERRFQPHTGEWVLPSVVEISMPTGMDLMCRRWTKVDAGGYSTGMLACQRIPRNCRYRPTRAIPGNLSRRAFTPCTKRRPDVRRASQLIQLEPPLLQILSQVHDDWDRSLGYPTSNALMSAMIEEVNEKSSFTPPHNSPSISFTLSCLRYMISWHEFPARHNVHTHLMTIRRIDTDCYCCHKRIQRFECLVFSHIISSMQELERSHWTDCNVVVISHLRGGGRVDIEQRLQLGELSL